MVSSLQKKKLLAFVHIEKAAGTTFIHILRHNFFLQYMDVRPFFKQSMGFFTSRDLNIVHKMLPSLRCISGHAVTPFSGLENSCFEVEYITIMRDPVKRYLSQYQHWVEKKKLDYDFEEFLELDELKNFQTKKYVGTDDLEKAKDILKEKFKLVGYVEAYDQFLVLLDSAFSDIEFDASYRRQNPAHNKISVKELKEKYIDRIEDNNKVDIALYEFVKNELFPSYIKEYGQSFNDDVEKFKASNEAFEPPRLRRWLDYLFRKVYVIPVSGLIRLFNGKPYLGSY